MTQDDSRSANSLQELHNARAVGRASDYPREVGDVGVALAGLLRGAKDGAICQIHPQIHLAFLGRFWLGGGLHILRAGGQKVTILGSLGKCIKIPLEGHCHGYRGLGG